MRGRRGADEEWQNLEGIEKRPLGVKIACFKNPCDSGPSKSWCPREERMLMLKTETNTKAFYTPVKLPLSPCAPLMSLFDCWLECSTLTVLFTDRTLAGEL